MNKTLLFPATVLLFVCGCKRELVRDSGDTKNPAASQNPTSYVLVSETWSAPATNQGASLEFSYDQQHLVSGIVAKQWGPIPNNLSTTTYHMEYSNGFITGITDDNGDRDSLVYNGNGELIEGKMGTSNPSTLSFRYDGSGNLSGLRQQFASGAGDNYHGFSYDGLKNMTLEIDTQLLGGNQLGIVKDAWSGYDGNVDFSLAINGLPPALFIILQTIGVGFNGQSNALLSPHNATTLADTVFAPMQPAGTYIVPFTYQYNPAGLPVACQYGGWSVTLGYQSDK